MVRLKRLSEEEKKVFNPYSVRIDSVLFGEMKLPACDPTYWFKSVVMEAVKHTEKYADDEYTKSILADRYRLPLMTESMDKVLSTSDMNNVSEELSGIFDDKLNKKSNCIDWAMVIAHYVVDRDERQELKGGMVRKRVPFNSRISSSVEK